MTATTEDGEVLDMIEMEVENAQDIVVRPVCDRGNFLQQVLVIGDGK